MVRLTLQLLIVISFILIGLKKYGALGAGCFSILALSILVIVFKVKPSELPISAILAIFSIGVAGSVMEANGGFDLMIYYAESLLFKFPKLSVILSPLLVFFIVFGIGTSNIILALEPVLIKIANDIKVEPKNILIPSVISANLGLLCSPAAACTIFVYTIIYQWDNSITFFKYLYIVVPSTIISILVLGFIFLLKSRKGTIIKEKTEEINEVNKVDFTMKAKGSLYLFIFIIILVLLSTSVPNLALRVSEGDGYEKVNIIDLIQILMYSYVAINLMFFKLKPKKILETKMLKNTIVSMITILGPGWVGMTLFTDSSNRAIITNELTRGIAISPIILLVFIACLSSIVMSQTAVASIAVPLALSLGISPIFLITSIQSLSLNFLIPSQPSILLAEELDQSGKTKRIKFILPGIFAIIISIIVANIIVLMKG